MGSTPLRCRAALDELRIRYKLEMEYRKVGFRDPALVYDEEKDLFRFRDGRFAFSYLIAYTAIVSLVRESLFPEVGE